MDGIEATRRIMAQRPTPIVVVAADFKSETVNNSMEALRAGALAVVEKPTIESADAYGAMARRLCDQFVNMSEVKVVRQRFNGLPPRRTIATPQPLGVADTVFDVIAIVASTGGPAAIAKLLQGLDRSALPPILVVQHMAAGFLDGYARWLGSVCGHDVSLARDLERPVSGRVYVAPGNCHLVYRGGQMRLVADSGGGGHVPSGDMLLSSLAAGAGVRALGVLLTGMGEDGAAGLLDLRQAGGFTIGQDQATSAVYGMPAAAHAIGAVREQLALSAIADRIMQLLGAPANRMGRVEA
jgi:two-component system chemotaxis response regulator CheB